MGTATLTGTIGATTVTLTDGLTLIDLQGAITATTLNLPATVDANVNLTGNGSTITNAFVPASLGTLTLGQNGGTQTYTAGLTMTGVVGTVTVNGTIQSTNTPMTFGAITLGSDAVLDTRASAINVADLTIGAVTGATHSLILDTGHFAGADISGTSVANVGTLTIRDVGTATLTGTIGATTVTLTDGLTLIDLQGAITATTLNLPATVDANVNMTGNGTSITNAFIPVSLGTLTLGQNGGTQTYTAGLTTTGVVGTVTVNGTIQSLNTPMTFGAITLGSDTALSTGAGSGNILVSGTINGGFNLGLDAGTGNVTVTGAIGAASPIGTLTVTGNILSINNIGTAGAAGASVVSLTASDIAGPTAGAINLTGTNYRASGTITFNAGALTNQVTLAGGGDTLVKTTGDLTVSSLIDGGVDLTLDVDGTATFSANAGANTKIGDGTGAALTINSTGATVFAGTLDTASGITQADGAGAVTFRENVTMTGGDSASVFNANVVLDGLTLTSDNQITFGSAGTDQVTLSGGDVAIINTYIGAGNGLTVNSKVDGGRDLTLNVTDTTAFNAAVGFTTPIGDATGAALTINSAGVTTFASTLGTASGITQANGAGLLTLRDNVTIGAGNTATNFYANVVLDGLTMNAGRDISFGNASTDQVTLSSAAVAVNTTANNGNIDFYSKIDGAQDLALSVHGTGDITLHAAIGSVTRPTDLTIAASDRVTLLADINLDAAGDPGDFIVTGGADIILGATLTIDTENGNDASGGAVDFGVSTISGDAPGRDLTINTSTAFAGGNGGAVSLGNMGNGHGAYLNDVSIVTTPGAGGTAGNTTLNGNSYLLDNNGGDLASLSIIGGGTVTLIQTTLIDTEQGGDATGGAVVFGTGTDPVALTANAIGCGFTINTRGLADAGNVTLTGAVNSGGQYVNDLAVNAAKTGAGTGGVVTFDTGTIWVVGNITATGGSIVFNSIGNIVTGGTGRATLTADTANIIGGTGAVDITARDLVAQAVAGIATSANYLQVQVANLEAQTQSGGIYIRNNGDLAIGGLTAMVGVSQTAGAVTDAVDIRSAGALTVNEAVDNSGGGNVLLASLGSGAADDVTVNANVTASGGAGNVTIYAGDTVAINAGKTVGVDMTGVVTVKAGTDYTTGSEMAGNDGGDIVMGSTARVESEDGDLVLSARDSIALGIVNADSNADGVMGNVTITAGIADGAGGTLGRITDANGSARNILAGQLDITTWGEMGSVNDPIELTADHLSILVRGAGSAYYSDTVNDVSLDLVAKTGDIEVRSTQDITIVNGEAQQGGVFLESLQDIVSLTGDSALKLTDNLTLTAGGVIGEIGRPVNFNISNGQAYISASGVTDSFSAILKGNISRTAVNLGNVAPGLVFYNGNVLGGALYGQAMQDLGQAVVTGTAPAVSGEGLLSAGLLSEAPPFVTQNAWMDDTDIFHKLRTPLINIRIW